MKHSREIMEELERTEGLLHKGLKEINDKGELTAQSLEVLGDTLDGILDVYKLTGTGYEMMEQYSGRMNYPMDYPMNHPYPMDMRRDGDNDGRYYERNRGFMYEGNIHNGYSRDSFLDELHRKMESAKTEQEREVIRGMIRDHER